MVEVIIGLAGGILIGATGAGTGSLLTPLLILAGYRPALAVGTGIGSLFVSKLVGSVAHRRLGHWPGRIAWFVIAGGLLGVALAWWIGTHWQLPLRPLIGITLLIGSAAATFASSRDPLGAQAPSPVLLGGVGFGVAAIVSITSAGSGSLLVTLLLVATTWRVPQLAAISNVFGSVIGAVSLGLQWHQRAFDLHLFALVMAGVVPGVLIGVVLSRWISRQWLVWVVYMLTIYLGIALLA